MKTQTLFQRGGARLAGVLFALLAVVIPLLPPAVNAQGAMTVAWDANPETDIAGYKVYLGTASGVYPTIQTSATTSTVVSGLSPSTTYYCAVQAYNTAGLTSELSTEISFTTAAPPAPEIALLDPSYMDLPNASVMDMGESFLGTAGTRATFTLVNQGNADLSGISALIDGPDASDFRLLPPAVGTLAAGASVSFTVEFAPQDLGSSTATLSIVSNDADENPFSIRLTGQGVTPLGTNLPEIVIERADGSTLVAGGSSLVFGSAQVGAVGVVQRCSIRNPGTADLSGIALTIDGPNAADFSVSTTPTGLLVPGASTSFAITFKPGAPGTRNAVVHVASNDPNENPFDLILTGTGLTQADIAVEKADGTNLTDAGTGVALGSVNLGASGSPQSFTIRSGGTAALTGLAITVDGSHASDFVVSAPTPTTLSVGASTTFTVAFKPTAAGARSATLHIASNDPDESPFDISLSGTGIALPEIAIEKSDGTNLIDGSSSVVLGGVNLGSTSSPQSFTIRSAGTAALTGLAVTVDGSHAADFTLAAIPSGTLNSGAATTFVVTFKPSAAGTRNATLHIASNDADENPFDINLSGIGIAVPEIAVEKADGSALTDNTGSVALGSVLLGSTGSAQSITIRDTGSAALTGLSVAVDGSHVSDFIVSQPAASTLLPGTATSFTVTFKPTAGGARSAVVHIASNDADENPFDITLTGNGGTLPEIAVERPDGANLIDGVSSHPFGALIPGTASVSQTFVVRSTGTADLTGLVASISGNRTGDFTVSQPATSVLKPGGFAYVTVSFKPGTIGTHTGTLVIASNDADENPFEIALTGSGMAVPEIAVENQAGINLDSGAAIVSFENVNLQKPGTTRTFRIRNLGTAALGGLALAITGTDAADFKATSLATTTLPPGESSEITVTFQPGAAGARNATLQISSDDADENPFSISLAGTGIATPDIDVTLADGTSLSGAKTPTSLGRVNLGASGKAVSFTIQNRGTADLRDIVLSTTGSHAADFIYQAPSTSTVAPGASTTFTVVFQPTAAGERRAALLIGSNDRDENPFEIALSGTGMPTPEIAVAVAGTGDLSDGTSQIDFGSADAGVAGSVKTFVIRNTGTGILSGLKAIRNGDHADDFEIISPGTKSLAPGASTTVKVAFHPSDSGTRTAVLRISSNDINEAVFDIALSGYGVPAPSIAVRVNGGGALTDDDAVINFGNASSRATGGTRTFTITNRGDAKLTGLALVQNGSASDDFLVTPLRTTSLSPGKSTTFKVSFRPGTSGTRWAALHIASNDPSTDSFDIVLTGRRGVPSSKAVLADKSHAGQPAAAKLRPVRSTVTIDGLKYRCITLPKDGLNDPTAASVQVSSDLVDWFSGRKHTTVIADNERFLKVRDNTPLTAGGKRHIRVGTRR